MLWGVERVKSFVGRMSYDLKVYGGGVWWCRYGG